MGFNDLFKSGIGEQRHEAYMVSKNRQHWYYENKAAAGKLKKGEKGKVVALRRNDYVESVGKEPSANWFKF